MVMLLAAALLAFPHRSHSAGKPDSPAVQSEAAAVVERVSTFYRPLTGFSVKVSMQVMAGPLGTPPRKIDSTLTVQKPNRFSAELREADGSTRVSSDGRLLTVLQSKANTYFQSPAPPEMALLLRRLAPGLDSLLAADPRKSIMEGVLKATVQGEELAGAVACDRVRFEQPGATVDMVVEKGAAPLLRRMVLKTEGAATTQVDVRFDEWKANPKVTAQTFAFVAPAGAKKVEPPQPQAEEARKVEVKPIVFAQGATIGVDFLKLHHTWAERVLLAPFRERVKAEPWREAAIAFVEKAVDDLAYNPTTVKTEALVEEGRKVLAAGCQDPLATYLFARINYRVEGNWRPAFTAFEDAIKRLGEDKGYGRALLCFIGKDLAVVGERGGRATGPVDKMIAAWTNEALQDGSYAPEDDVIFVQHHFNPQWHDALERNFRALAPIFERSRLPEWAKKTLHGYLEVSLAWAARGDGWANTVTEEGWKGFSEHMTKAKGELTRAWELNPHQPEAATGMIAVVMGGEGQEGEDVRLWFDRATAAQFDYPSAYEALLWAYRPRWGGSHEQMLAFGRACRDTKRYDTSVPRRLVKAVDDIVSELDDPRAFYREQPKVLQEILDLYRALMKEPSRGTERKSWASLLAVHAWLGRDFKAAAGALSEVGGKLDSDADDKLRAFHSSPSEMVADIALNSSPGAREFARAEEAMAKFDLNTAKQAYEAAAKLAPAPAAPLVRSRLAVVDFERSLTSGDWVKIIPAADLLEWSVRSGKWESDGAGTLIERGTDASGLIVFRGRVGADFEVRGQFAIEARDNCCRMLGVAVGYHEPKAEDWINCTVYQGGKSAPIATAFEGFYRGKAKQVRFDVKPQNQFLVRSQGGTITYEVNGQSILDSYVPPTGTTQLPDGQIGFAGVKFCANNTTRINGIEVRRIAPKPR